MQERAGDDAPPLPVLQHGSRNERAVFEHALRMPLPSKPAERTLRTRRPTDLPEKSQMTLSDDQKTGDHDAIITMRASSSEIA